MLLIRLDFEEELLIVSVVTTQAVLVEAQIEDGFLSFRIKNYFIIFAK